MWFELCVCVCSIDKSKHIHHVTRHHTSEITLVKLAYQANVRFCEWRAAYANPIIVRVTMHIISASPQVFNSFTKSTTMTQNLVWNNLGLDKVHFTAFSSLLSLRNRGKLTISHCHRQMMMMMATIPKASTQVVFN